MKTEQTKVEYLDHHGSDLLVVNAARASFGKESEWAERDPEQVGDFGHLLPKKLKPEDANLIRFLATGYRTAEWEEFLDNLIAMARRDNAPKEEIGRLLWNFKRKAQHWAPFAHPHCTIRIHIPIFLARQFVKHQIGGVWSEESRRYISDEPGVWFLDEWHTRPEDIKQGAGTTHENSEMWDQAAREHTKNALAFYGQAVGSGVAPEEARIVLPLNMMTTVVWTGSLLFWSRVCNQRVDSHAQLAAQELGKKISSIMQPLYPVSWKELTGM